MKVQFSEVLYHCERCGHVVHCAPHAPQPQCCGCQMSLAAKNTMLVPIGGDPKTPNAAAPDSALARK